MTARIFIDGGAGTTGLEIRERLAGRGDIALVTLPDSHRKDRAARADALNEADAVILCLPDAAAREAVSLIRNPATRVIDASTAHRTDPAWAYGFAELEPDGRQRLSGATRVSNPGCYPTGFLALVRPLVRAGIVPRDLALSVNATSGYSGGGKSMIAEFENGDTDTAFRTYGLTMAHKHVPEMHRHSGLAHAPAFLPAVARTYRGMLVEVPLHLHQLKGDLAAIREALAEAYSGSALIHLVEEDLTGLTIERCAGTDRLDLFVFGNERTGQVRLAATLDNLGKGAAGAAVQNLNLVLGLDEASGLRL
jgi:N-acetyl-gamma-glutamyl-phosphate reductase